MMRTFFGIAVLILGLGQNHVQAQQADVFFSENFSTYEDGDYLTQWGDDVMIVQGRDSVKYLTSQVPGDHQVEQSLQFPTDFTFEFTWSNPTNSSHLYFKDDQGEGIRIDFHFINYYGDNSLDIKFGNTVSKRKQWKREKRTNLRIKVIRKGQTVKLFVDDVFFVSTRLPELGNVQGFRMVVPEGQYFADFKGTKLVLPE